VEKDDTRLLTTFVELRRKLPEVRPSHGRLRQHPTLEPAFRSSHAKDSIGSKPVGSGVGDEPARLRAQPARSTSSYCQDLRLVLRVQSSLRLRLRRPTWTSASKLAFVHSGTFRESSDASIAE